jgi:hypothetical protein
MPATPASPLSPECTIEDIDAHKRALLQMNRSVADII